MGTVSSRWLWLDIDILTIKMRIRKMFSQLLFPFILSLAKAETRDGSITPPPIEHPPYASVAHPVEYTSWIGGSSSSNLVDLFLQVTGAFVKETIYTDNGDLLSETVQYDTPHDTPSFASVAHP